jgi:4-hydroxy-tetrahydrodipicolinate synthase
LQKTLTAARVLFQDYPLVAALKETMALISGNDEWRNILPPNTPLSKEQRVELDARLRQIPAMLPVMESLRAA